MKKIICTLVALCAIVALGASSLLAENMMFGVKGGINLANVTGEGAVDNSIKIGGVGGAFLCYKLSDIFAIQPELLFTMKGAKFDADSANAEETTANLNYFEIPLLLKVLLPTEGKIKPALFAGPALGILLSSKQTNGDEIDMKDDTKSMDIGIVVGGSVAYEMEKGALCFDVRYEVGFQTISDPQDSDEDAADLKNSVISFLVGYGFAF